jgi:hypothetical protein
VLPAGALLCPKQNFFFGHAPEPISLQRHNDEREQKKTKPDKKMKSQKWILGSLLLSLALPFSAATALAADTQPSAKVTAKTSRLTLLPATTSTGGWTDVLSNTIKTASQKDLFIGTSFEIGLYTRTLVKSKNMVTDTSVARSAVQIRVLVDGVPVEPGAVVFGRRNQTLSATLEGQIANALTVDPTTGAIVIDETLVVAEQIELILATMDAAAFNFVGINVPQGVHTIKVQARIRTGGSAEDGEYESKALVGKGSMTVESVRLIKDDNVILDVL